MFSTAHRHPVSAGFVAMFAYTWPVDRWAAAASRGGGRRPAPVLPLLIGCGFVVAAVLMSGIVDGAGGGPRVAAQVPGLAGGWRWYLVVLVGPATISAAAVGGRSGRRRPVAR